MKELAALVILLVGLSVCTRPIAADQPQLPSLEERKKRLELFNPAVPERLESADSTDQQTRQAYLAALQAYYAYRAQGYEHRRAAFEWQFFSSKVIFAVVLALVFTGIYFAAVQFRAGIGARKRGPEEATEFVLDLKGLRLRSPVLGVVILALSLGFLYMYLVFVYPINSVF